MRWRPGLPPVQLIDAFNKEVRMMGLEEDTEIYYILPAFKVQTTVNALTGVGKLAVYAFGGKNNKTLLHRKLTTRLSLIVITSPDKWSPSESKRLRLSHWDIHRLIVYFSENKINTLFDHIRTKKWNFLFDKCFRKPLDSFFSSFLITLKLDF